MFKFLFVIILLTQTLGALASLPTHAQQPGDSLATAQAAQATADAQQWRANQAAAQAQSARATAQAAYAEATTQAVKATATANWMATATPAAATAQAQATRQALEIEGTRQAIYAQATQAAHRQAVVATATSQAQIATATKVAALAELDRMAVERQRVLQPLYTWGPWLLAAILAFVVGALLILAIRADRPPPRAHASGMVIEGEFYPGPPRALLPEKAGIPCILRSIKKDNAERGGGDGSDIIQMRP